MDTFSMHIAGATSTNNLKELKSPYNQEVIAKIEIADEAAIEKALSNAQESYEKIMRDMPAHERADILYKVAEKIGEHHEELSLIIAKEGGKPLKDARVEVTRAINTTKMSADEALQLAGGEVISMDRAKGTENHIAMTIREPLGVVVAISAFNHPLNLICHQMCTAFAAGNSVVVKPASQTPVSALKMASFFKEAGLADGVISVLTAPGRLMDAVVADKRVKFVTFIGGEDVGWALRNKVQPGVRLALEHGGTGTALVHKDADLDFAIPNIVRSAFYHAGQVCVSSQIVKVHEEIAAEFTERVQAEIGKLVTGDPSDAATDVGPLISHKDCSRVHEWVEDAVSKGATLHCGGKAISESCYEPTLISGLKDGMTLSCKEVFGPVLCLQSYSDIDEAISDMNNSEYSFQSAVYSQDIDTANRAARKIETKACMINDMTAFRVDWMPFGGTKASVSSMMRSSGISLKVSRTLSAFLKVMVPGILTIKFKLSRRFAKSAFSA